MPARLNEQYLIRAIENEPENVVGGIMIPFTTPQERDWVNNDWFDAQTNLGLDVVPANAQRPANYEHNRGRIMNVGFVRSVELRPEGLWAVTELDADHPSYPFILDAVAEGQLGYSAETTPGYFVRADSGHIEYFVPFAVALAARPTAPNRRTQVGLLRASYDNEVLGLPAETPDNDEIMMISHSVWGYAQEAPAPRSVHQSTIPYAQTQPRQNATLPTPQARADIPLAGNINGMQSPIDQVPLLDVVGWYTMNQVAHASKHRRIEFPIPEEQLVRGMMTRIIQDIEEDSKLAEPWYPQARVFLQPDGELQRSMGAWDILARHLSKSYKSAGLVRADEVIGTGLSTGQDFIYDAHSLMIYKEIRSQSRVFGLFPTFIMQSKTHKVPKLANPTYAKRVVQTTDQSELSLTATPYGIKTPDDSNITFSIVDKFGAIITWSDEWRHWNNLDYLGALQGYAVEMLWRTADRIILHGDETDTTANIGYYAAAGNSPTTDGLTWLLLADGIIHHCLVGNGTTTDNANSALEAADFATSRGKLGAIGLDPTRLAHICNPKLAQTAMTLTELETVDQFGPNATIRSGQVGKVYGVDLVHSEDFNLTDGDGKVNQTGGSNTQSAFATVHRDAWLVGLMWNMDVSFGSAHYADAEYIKARMAFDIQPLQDNAADYSFDIV